MTQWFAKIHPRLKVETGWGYFYHLWHSIQNTCALIVIAFKSVVHGLSWIWKADALKELFMYHANYEN